jgi:hypothetical protein
VLNVFQRSVLSPSRFQRSVLSPLSVSNSCSRRFPAFQLSALTQRFQRSLVLMGFTRWENLGKFDVPKFAFFF